MLLMYEWEKFALVTG